MNQSAGVTFELDGFPKILSVQDSSGAVSYEVEQASSLGAATICGTSLPAHHQQQPVVVTSQQLANHSNFIQLMSGPFHQFLLANHVMCSTHALGGLHAGLMSEGRELEFLHALFAASHYCLDPELMKAYGRLLGRNRYRDDEDNLIYWVQLLRTRWSVLVNSFCAPPQPQHQSSPSFARPNAYDKSPVKCEPLPSLSSHYSKSTELLPVPTTDPMVSASPADSGNFSLGGDDHTELADWSIGEDYNSPVDLQEQCRTDRASLIETCRTNTDVESVELGGHIRTVSHEEGDVRASEIDEETELENKVREALCNPNISGMLVGKIREFLRAKTAPAHDTNDCERINQKSDESIVSSSDGTCFESIDLNLDNSSSESASVP